MRWRAPTLLGVLLLLSAVAVFGCGDGDSTSKAEAPKDPLAGYPKGPTRQFIVPGGDNIVQESGHEASPQERKQTTATVEGWLRARVAGRWGKVCAFMARRAIADALQAASSITGKRFTSCAKAIPVVTNYEAEPPRYNIKGGVASLRIDEGAGNAQYHGNDGRDWILPVRREGGEWKVAHPAPIDRMK